MRRAREDLNAAISQASKETGIKFHEILSRARRTQVVKARRRVAVLLRDCHWTAKQIADGLNLHPDTVEHYLKDAP